MTWRERALRAEGAGWRLEDLELWRNVRRCPAAEIAGTYGISWADSCGTPWRALWHLGANELVFRSEDIPISLIDPKRFLTVLDEMEDFALTIKREEEADHEHTTNAERTRA